MLVTSPTLIGCHLLIQNDVIQSEVLDLEIIWSDMFMLNIACVFCVFELPVIGLC